eukprot:m.29124 g.29124  ORF g.29124 m.29124 type:complete len:67 (+) comp9123_c0_seq1:210-410(+)
MLYRLFIGALHARIPANESHDMWLHVHVAQASSQLNSKGTSAKASTNSLEHFMEGWVALTKQRYQL